MRGICEILAVDISISNTGKFFCAAINIRVSAIQFRMAPHQTKKGKHESNTSDVLRTGEGQSATGDRELSWQHTGNPGSARHLQKHLLRMESRSRDWQGVTPADRKLDAQLLSRFAGSETPEDDQQDSIARTMLCASTFVREARHHRRTSRYAQLLRSRSLRCP